MSKQEPDILLASLKKIVDLQIKNNNSYVKSPKSTPSRVLGEEDQKPEAGIFKSITNFVGGLVSPITSLFQTKTEEELADIENAKGLMAESMALTKILSWRDDAKQNLMIKDLQKSVTDLSKRFGISLREIKSTDIEAKMKNQQTGIQDESLTMIREIEKQREMEMAQKREMEKQQRKAEQQREINKLVMESMDDLAPERIKHTAIPFPAPTIEFEELKMEIEMPEIKIDEPEAKLFAAEMPEIPEPTINPKSAVEPTKPESTQVESQQSASTKAESTQVESTKSEFKKPNIPPLAINNQDSQKDGKDLGTSREEKAFDDHVDRIGSARGATSARKIWGPATARVLNSSNTGNVRTQ